LFLLCELDLVDSVLDQFSLFYRCLAVFTLAYQLFYKILRELFFFFPRVKHIPHFFIEDLKLLAKSGDPVSLYLEELFK
jgi:hypothetical protein